MFRDRVPITTVLSITGILVAVKLSLSEEEVAGIRFLMWGMKIVKMEGTGLNI